MRKALLRLEDIGPGGRYGTEEALRKLRAIADFLHSEGVLFHVSVIPRYVDPATGEDRSITDVSDPFVAAFRSTLDHLRARGASIGMHGYTHQYGTEGGPSNRSGEGEEFALPAPDDPEVACESLASFDASYASSRMRAGFELFRQAGLQPEWFATPHYTASPNQRRILEGWTGLFFEDQAGNAPRGVTVHRGDGPFHGGVVYVPTPLGFVSEADPELDVARIHRELEDYGAEEIAGLYYHPHLDFPFLASGDSGELLYDEGSHLRRLVRRFQELGFVFVHLLSLVAFTPSVRETGFFPGLEHRFFVGDATGDGATRSELIIWHRDTGTWYTAAITPDLPLCRHQVGFVPRWALSGWGVAGYWRPRIGDFDGDGRDDVAIWNPNSGAWQVALRRGDELIPTPSASGDSQWLAVWGVGSAWHVLVGDFDGRGRDGIKRDDLAAWAPRTGEWQVALSNGRGFAPTPSRTGQFAWLTGWPAEATWRAFTGDFDGDGRDDLIVWDPMAGDWQVALSTGTEFVPTPAQSGDLCWLRGWPPGPGWRVLARDLDGDGRTDLLAVDADQGWWRVARNMGGGFMPIEEAFGPWSGSVDMQPLVGLFGIDGRACICSRHPHLHGGTLDLAVCNLGL